MQSSAKLQALVGQLQVANQRAKAERLLARETVVVYEPGIVWTGKIPYEELRQHLPIKCRYVPESNAARWWGALLGASLAALVIVVVLYQGAQFTLLGSLFLGIPMGGLLGGLIGLILGPRYGPKPFWLVRRRTLVNEETGEVTGQLVIPILYQDLMPPPGIKVHTASGVYEMLRMRDVRAFFTGGMSRWKKLEIGLLASVAIGLAVVMVLFVIATTGAKPT